MYKYLLILLLSGCATTWVPIGGTNHYTYYAAETASGGITGNMSTEEMVNFNTEQEQKGHRYRSIMGEGEYNCLTNMYRITEEYFFSGQMGKGDIIFAHKRPSNWERVIPGRANATILMLVCAQQQAQRQQMMSLYLATSIFNNIQQSSQIANQSLNHNHAHDHQLQQFPDNSHLFMGVGFE